ncbi:ABC transporter substrate-binding protein [Actinoplanes sp. OR16]|nr:ABC transporter substrate-binding protein [Actinoplanes sp. OR16]
MKRMYWIAGIAAATTVMAGCGASGGQSEAAPVPEKAKLAVVATTPEVADFVRNIGGADVDVTQIIKPNVDPHDYEPTPADLQAISKAKIVVKNGVGLEEWLDRTIDSAGFAGTVVDSSAGVTLREGGHDHEGEEEGHEHDPHIWHDPRNAKIMVANIEKGLAAADPAKAAAFTTNLTRYQAELDKLDTDNATAWSTVQNKKIVTNHDAFGYYIARYDLAFVGSVIPSLDTSAELSAKQLSDLVSKIKSTGTTAIFAESSLPPKTAEAIAQQAGVKVVAGEDALFGDSLGPDGSYLEAERHNTRILTEALAN